MAPSSAASWRHDQGHYLPSVCCVADNALDGVFLSPRYIHEIVYMARYQNDARFLTIDTKGPETVDRV